VPNGRGTTSHLNSGDNGSKAETFQQLRQAVLSSLDFSDNAENTQDWEDSALDSGDEFAVEPQGSAAAVGKAVYEVLEQFFPRQKAKCRFSFYVDTRAD